MANKLKRFLTKSRNNQIIHKAFKECAVVIYFIFIADEINCPWRGKFSHDEDYS